MNVRKQTLDTGTIYEKTEGFEDRKSKSLQILIISLPQFTHKPFGTPDFLTSDSLKGKEI